MLILRIFAGVVIVAAIVVAVDYFAETGFLAALGQWLVRGWQLFIRWLQPIAERFMLRRLVRPLWTVLTMLGGYTVGRFIGEKRRSSLTRWLKSHRRGFLAGFARIWNKRPNWPKWVYASIAFVSIAGAVWGFFYINNTYGMIWGFWYSVVATLLIQKLPFIGLDQLLDRIAERYGPFKRWYRRVMHRFPGKAISYLWLRPPLRQLKLHIHRKRRMQRSAPESWTGKWVAIGVTASIVVVCVDYVTGTHLLHTTVTELTNRAIETAHAWSR